MVIVVCMDEVCATQHIAIAFHNNGKKKKRTTAMSRVTKKRPREDIQVGNEHEAAVKRVRFAPVKTEPADEEVNVGAGTKLSHANIPPIVTRNHTASGPGKATSLSTTNAARIKQEDCADDSQAATIRAFARTWDGASIKPEHGSGSNVADPPKSHRDSSFKCFQNPETETMLFRGDWWYRLLFHPIYLMDLSKWLTAKLEEYQEDTLPPHVLAEGNTSGLDPDVFRAQCELLIHMLPVCATSMGFRCNAVQKEKYSRDMANILSDFERIITGQEGNMFKFRLLIMLVIYFERETLLEHVSQISDKSRLDYMMKLLETFLDPKRNPSFFTRFTRENNFNLIVKTIETISWCYMLMPKLTPCITGGI